LHFCIGSARKCVRLRKTITQRSLNDHQDNRQNNCADQLGQEDDPTGRRVQDDLASPSLFGGIWFLLHETPPAR
jgi:hypothetical protein